MELFQKSENFILLPLCFLLSLVINVHHATIPYDFQPKETRRILGDKFSFSLTFTGTNEKSLQAYAFVTVSVAPHLDSKGDALMLIYSFPVLKKSGEIKGHIGKSNPFYRQISDIRTVKSGTTQTFSMEMRMICRLSTNFKFALVKDSKTSQFLGKARLNSYSITSLGIVQKKSVFYPGDKLKVDCQINECNNLDTDKNKLKYDKFLLTSQRNSSATIPPTNSSAIVMNEHDNVIDTKFGVSKDFVMTCVPIDISCTLDKKTWKTRRTITPDVDKTFCRNKRMEFKVKWGENNYTDNLNYVADGATFTTICTAFVPKKTDIVSEGEPAKVVSRVSLAEETQNLGEFAVKQLTSFRNDDAFCYYPRKTFRCFINDTASERNIKPIPFRPTACEPKLISFKPQKEGKHKLNLTCIIRKTRGERLNKTGIVDDNESINITKKVSNMTDIKRNRDAIVMNGNVSFSTCDNLKGRNLTCWYYYDGKVFTTELDLSKICKGKSYLWLLWLLLLLLIPLLCCCCGLLCACCRRRKKRRKEAKKEEEEEEEEEEEMKKEKKVKEKKVKVKKEKKKKTKEEKAEEEMEAETEEEAEEEAEEELEGIAMKIKGKKAKEKKVKEKKVKEKKVKEKKKKVEEEKPSKVKPSKTKKEKQAEAKRIEAERMYRMFKKRRPFGWRELNDHFLWLSMMAQDEQRTRSLSPSCHEYAQFRLMKRRTRFGNRELMSYSQTLRQQGVRTEEDLATLRDLESCYGNWSQLTVSPDPSNARDELDTEARKEAHRQKIITELYNEGAIGSYNQLESFEYVQNIQDPQSGEQSSESSNSSSYEDSKTNNNQQQSRRRRKWKHRRSRRNDDIV